MRNLILLRRALGALTIAAMLVVVPVSLHGNAQQGDPPPPANAVQATVTEIVDGDTIGVLVDGRSYRLRYIGVDTPETTFGKNDPYGAEATEFNRSLVEGKTVLIAKDVSETDRYGRLLRYVWVDGLFVNAELVRRGYAQVATYPPDVAYVELFVALEREARDARRGLWGLGDSATGSVTLTVLADRLNVRSGPGTNYAIVGSLTKGAEIAATGISADGGWYLVNQNQRVAWVSGDLRLVRVAGDPAALQVTQPLVPIAPSVRATSTLPAPVNAVAPQPTTASAAPCNCNVGDYDCGDFATHNAAQACWTFCGGSASNNLWGLDRDRDGVACESLP